MIVTKLKINLKHIQNRDFFLFFIKKAIWLCRIKNVKLLGEDFFKDSELIPEVVLVAKNVVK